MKSQHTDHRVAKSSRAERAARDPRDISNPDLFPQLGRDVPYKEGPDGYPVPVWETRVQAYGSHGFYHETKCTAGCGKWLSYKMCAPCQSMLRLFGSFDRECRCRLDSLVIYLNCDDHKVYEDPVS
jgi:hypothetical protein